MKSAAFAAFAMCAGSCFAQLTSTVSLNNGVQLRVIASLGQPTGEESLTVELLPSISGNGFYRLFRDQGKLVVFAYELVVVRAGNGDEFKITLRPTGGEFAMKYPEADGGKPVPTISQDRELTPLRSGGRAEIGLFEIPGMGLKVTDAIEVKLNQGASATSAKTTERLRFQHLKVYLNQSLISNAASPGAVAGRYVMFYIPGKGGYFFSTDMVTEPQFTKAGSVDKAHMRFTIDNESYECVADSPILPNTDRAEIWVYHDAAYKPSGNLSSDKPDQKAADAFFTAASDSLSWWVTTAH